MLWFSIYLYFSFKRKILICIELKLTTEKVIATRKRELIKAKFFFASSVNKLLVIALVYMTTTTCSTFCLTFSLQLKKINYHWKKPKPRKKNLSD